MPRQSSSYTLWSAQVLTGAAEINSNSIECGHYTEGVVYIRATAKGGTSPTVDIDVESSHDNSNWHKHTDITQISDPTVIYYQTVTTLSNLGRYIRLTVPAGGVGGSATPTITVTAVVVLKD